RASEPSHPTVPGDGQLHGERARGARARSAIPAQAPASPKGSRMKHPFRKIMVATDGSEPSMRAAAMAIEIPHNYGAELLAVHVVDEEVLREFCRSLGKNEKQARETLAADA